MRAPDGYDKFSDQGQPELGQVANCRLCADDDHFLGMDRTVIRLRQCWIETTTRVLFEQPKDVMDDVTRFRVLDSEDFRTIATDSIKRGYNRLPSDELLEALDPDGLHVLELTLPHEHINGRRVDLHMRTEWLVKIVDEDKPVRVFMDMSWDNYNAIPEREREEILGPEAGG